MDKRKQAAYGRQGGSAKGPSKRRDVDYAALARRAHEAREANKAGTPIWVRIIDKATGGMLLERQQSDIEIVVYRDTKQEQK